MAQYDVVFVGFPHSQPARPPENLTKHIPVSVAVGGGIRYDDIEGIFR